MLTLFRPSRRKRYYNRCQELIDDLHRRVANGQSVSEAECISRYGKSDYCALLHELHLMHADTDTDSMPPAMEWLHHSQYFLHKADDEHRQSRLLNIAIASAIASAFSALGAMASAIVAACSAI